MYNFVYELTMEPYNSSSISSSWTSNIVPWGIACDEKTTPFLQLSARTATLSLSFSLMLTPWLRWKTVDVAGASCATSSFGSATLHLSGTVGWLPMIVALAWHGPGPFLEWRTANNAPSQARPQLSNWSAHTLSASPPQRSLVPMTPNE